MDIATVAGIFAAFGLVLSSMALGGGLSLFINVPSMLIVVGGTIGATFINYPLKEVFGIGGVVKNAFFHQTRPTSELISTLVDFAGKARKDGILGLQSVAKEVGDAFLEKGIQMAVDGQEADNIENILSTEIDYIRDRHKLGAEIMTVMGTFAPAMGLIGTLIGLVQMLQNMSDPSTIGPAMAVALLTTFYGAVMANLIFLPIAGKLKTRSSQEILIKELILEGIISIASGDNPRIMEQKLHTYLSPKLRESSFDK